MADKCLMARWRAEGSALDRYRLDAERHHGRGPNQERAEGEPVVSPLRFYIAGCGPEALLPQSTASETMGHHHSKVFNPIPGG